MSEYGVEEIIFTISKSLKSIVDSQEEETVRFSI